ncbi:resistance to o-dinitrobenzene [Coemansia sp. RSA 2336]|nr:resistance to o-dinitrobenzene [Coemansia sp. RSA 2336]
MLYLRTSILPDSTHVVLRGQPSEASSQSLSGRVLFGLAHSLKVKRVTVVFQSVGSSKSQLPAQNGCAPVHIEQVVFDASDSPNGWILWKPNRCARNATNYEFPFEFVLPGNLHESANTPFGSVCYEIKATVHTCGFGINTWSESVKVPVYRIPQEGSSQALQLTDALHTQADWLGAVELLVSHGTMAVADSSKINVHIAVRPLQKGLMLADIGLQLSETICHKSLTDKFGDLRRSQTTVSVRRKVTGDAANGLTALPLCQDHALELPLSIPKAFSGIQYTMNTPRVTISHELVLIATLIDQDDNPRHLRIASNIRVVPKVALENNFVELPPYHNIEHDRLLLGSSAHQLAYFTSPPPSYSHVVSTHI